MQCFLYKIEQFLEMSVGVVLVSVGLSLMMKSGLGQTSLTAFTQCISILADIKSGTIVTCFYLLCVLLQIVLQKTNFEKIQLLQIVVSWTQGFLINLFCVDIPFFATIVPTSYVQQWVFVLAGIVLLSLGVACTMAAELVKQPFEQLVMLLSKRYKIAFSLLRSGCDALFIVVSLILIIIFSLDFTILREGTWLSMFLLGNTMAFAIPFMQHHSFHYRKTHFICKLDDKK